MTNQLAFHNTQLNIVTHNNQSWLTAKELAKALNYKNTKSIANLYNENEDEFTIGMSLVIDSVTNGINGSSRRLKMRIFSLRGAHLIAMFSRTPVAKEFRRWVLDVLDRQIGDPVVQPAPSTPTYPPISDDYANRTEMIYYLGFKPIFCRVLRPEEIVMSHEVMKEWLEMQGLIFFTIEEIKDLTVSQLAGMIDRVKNRRIQ